MQEVLIPFVLAGLVFYALDPLVDRLQRLRVPRSLGAGLALALVVGATAFTVYTFLDDAMKVVEELPVAARNLRAKWAADNEPSAIERVQDAAREIEKTAAAASSPDSSTPAGVARVRIEEPGLSAGDYVWWTSVGALTLLGQASLVLFLAYFLLVYDDLFKRKLVENIGPRLSQKKITVQILNDIALQIERYLLVQIFTSAVVGVATGVTLWAVGLRHPWVWGIAAGVFNFVPYFGPLIIAGGLAIVAFLQFGTLEMAAGIAGL